MVCIICIESVEKIGWAHSSFIFVNQGQREPLIFKMIRICLLHGWGQISSFGPTTWTTQVTQLNKVFKAILFELTYNDPISISQILAKCKGLFLQR